MNNLTASQQLGNLAKFPTHTFSHNGLDSSPWLEVICKLAVTKTLKKTKNLNQAVFRFLIQFSFITP